MATPYLKGYDTVMKVARVRDAILKAPLKATGAAMDALPPSLALPA